MVALRLRIQQLQSQDLDRKFEIAAKEMELE